MFLLNQELHTPSDNLNHQDTHVCEKQGQDDYLNHATDLSHNFALPQFMTQHNYEDLKPTDLPESNPEFNTDDVIGRTFLLLPQDNGERLIEKAEDNGERLIGKADGERVQNLSYILGFGNGKMEEITPYNQLVDHLDAANEYNEEDNEISDDLYKFRAFICHQGPFKATDPNIPVEWEPGEKTYEPLSVLAADNPVTCATFAKENDPLHVDGWKRFRNLAKRGKIPTRAVMQSNIRQPKRSNKYMFGYLIPKSCKEAFALDKENNNSKWVDATRDEMDCIKEQEVFTKSQRAKWESSHKQILSAPCNHQKIKVNLIFTINFNGRHKARPMADDSPTPDPGENIY